MNRGSRVVKGFVKGLTPEEKAEILLNLVGSPGACEIQRVHCGPNDNIWILTSRKALVFASIPIKKGGKDGPTEIQFSFLFQPNDPVVVLPQTTLTQFIVETEREDP